MFLNGIEAIHFRAVQVLLVFPQHDHGHGHTRGNEHGHVDGHGHVDEHGRARDRGNEHEVLEFATF